MAEKIQIHKRNIKARLESLKEWKTPEENKKDLVLFLKDLEIGKVNRGKRISEGRQLKYLDMLKITFTFWNKDISQIELKDIEDFERAISSNEILSFKKKPFSNESKRDIKIALKIYIKWKLGEAKALELCGWLDTRRIAKTPDYMKESEVVKLYKACKNAKERYLLALLFDSGARAEEFINIRYYYSDLHGTRPCYKHPLTVSRLKKLCNRSNQAVSNAVRILANTVPHGSESEPLIYYDRIKSEKNNTHRPYRIFLRD